MMKNCKIYKGYIVKYYYSEKPTLLFKELSKKVKKKKKASFEKVNKI